MRTSPLLRAMTCERPISSFERCTSMDWPKDPTECEELFDLNKLVGFAGSTAPGLLRCRWKSFAGCRSNGPAPLQLP